MENAESVRVVALKVRDFKRIEAFDASFSPGLTLLAGPNGAGKSSVLDAVVAALGGKRAVPPRPVRDGASEAEVVVDLDPYVVRRFFRADGETALSVERKDGEAVPSPQTFLDSLAGRGEVFDPLSPLRERPERLAEILRGVAGLDFRDLDNRRAHLYARRTEVGRSRKTAEGAAKLSPHHPEAPAEPVDVSALRTAQLQAFDQSARHYRAKRVLREIEDDISRTQEEVKALEAKLLQVRTRLEHLCLDRESATADLSRNPEPDMDGIESRLREADDVNARVAANRERQARLDAAAEHAARYDELTEEIAAIDREKAERLAAARFPVAGLTIDDLDRVLLDGIPIEQASSGQRIELGLALAAALRPGLRTLLVREGSLLDAEAIARVRDWASSRDVSVLLEVVEDAPGEVPGAIEIRAGRVVEGSMSPSSDGIAERYKGGTTPFDYGGPSAGSGDPVENPSPRAGRPVRKGDSRLFPEGG